jgi:protease II
VKPEYQGKKLVITDSDGHEWYRNYIGQTFVIQSESRDKKCFVVRTTRKQAGWPYGWVDKRHCKLVD